MVESLGDVWKDGARDQHMSPFLAAYDDENLINGELVQWRDFVDKFSKIVKEGNFYGENAQLMPQLRPSSPFPLERRLHPNSHSGMRPGLPGNDYDIVQPQLRPNLPYNEISSNIDRLVHPESHSSIQSGFWGDQYEKVASSTAEVREQETDALFRDATIPDSGYVSACVSRSINDPKSDEELKKHGTVEKPEAKSRLTVDQHTVYNLRFCLTGQTMPVTSATIST